MFGLASSGMMFRGWERSSQLPPGTLERASGEIVSGENPGRLIRSSPRADEEQLSPGLEQPPNSIFPDWFHPGWREDEQCPSIGVFVEGQISLLSAEEQLLAKLREEILGELGFGNVTDASALPELSPQYISTRLIPKGRIQLEPYEDDLTREAAALEGRTPAPYFRGFAQASLPSDFFRQVERWKLFPKLRESLKWVGLCAGAVLTSLVLLFGYLKVDQTTHSLYTRRLQSAFLLLLAGLAGLVCRFL
jgi:hypothetical protein